MVWWSDGVMSVVECWCVVLWCGVLWCEGVLVWCEWWSGGGVVECYWSVVLECCIVMECACDVVLCWSGIVIQWCCVGVVL